MDFSYGVTICTMVMFIITSSCSVLAELFDFVPDTLSPWSQGALLIGWGLFTVFAVAMAASGLSPSLFN
jgi:hypothetical protein